MSQIQPAMTPEDWDERVSSVREMSAEDWALLGAHETAAICLHGQPFGFTWEDVDLLRRSATPPHDSDPLDGLAARIAALLPPRNHNP